jgi:hypothetical protein
MKQSWWIVTAVLLSGAASAQAQESPAPASPAAPPALKLCAADETLPVALQDDHRNPVTLRVPRSLHRDANRFRLYGARPLTLQSYDRRRDLYRDAFLEIATRAQLCQASNAWDSLTQQWEWLRTQSPEVQRLYNAALATQVPGVFQRGITAPAKASGDLLKDLASKPGYPQVSALLKALASADFKPEAADPMVEALQLRALATDEAAQRLRLLGEALRLQSPETDPAMREGYLAARTEFEEVRQGLWPALVSSMRKNQGRLVLSAVKQIALSRVGWWAIFGQLAWQGVESSINTEYRGQYSICLATVATRLSESCEQSGPRVGPEPRVAFSPLALYAEYVLNYQLTEALKTGQVLPLQPAGGRSTATWQIQFTGRCNELRLALATPIEPTPRMDELATGSQPEQLAPAR